MLTSEARLALLAISRQFPNGAEVLRHEIETKDAEIERLRTVVEAARELMAARGPHIEGSVPLKNALAALEGDSHA